MQFLGDVVVLALAFFLANLPAINIRVADFYTESALTQISFVVFIQIATLSLLGTYSIIWRYISLRDIRMFVWSAIISASILVILRFSVAHTAFSLWRVSLSVILIDTFLGFGGILSLRLIRRFVYEFQERNHPSGRPKTRAAKAALLIGAGRTGATLAREIAGRADAHLSIKGFVDDDPRKRGLRVSGVKVLGDTSMLDRLVRNMQIETVVITADSDDGKEIRRITELCVGLPVKTQFVPSLNELSGGKLSISRIRTVEIEDILKRDPVILETEDIRGQLSGKTIMVTGAGGSIGSELVRQILNFNPAVVLLVERSEFHLFEIYRELDGGGIGSEIIPLIADIGDKPRMRVIFEIYRPEIIYHAAAHKHVSLMEVNAIEAVKNNILATQDLASLAAEFSATHFVLISTDKAVNPTSVMGASKRMAELVVQGLDRSKNATRFIAVRFGNVLGSAGSVVPIFRDQIKKGGPVTVTDPEMTRYFMTIPEASQLVLQAGAIGSGGEIFVLDMGEPVKILDLAEDMIRLSGLVPYDEIGIVFSGIRQGEKLFEELEITGENLEKTHHPKIYIGKIARYHDQDIAQMLSAFRSAVENNNEALLRRLFNEFFTESNVIELQTSAASMESREEKKFFTRAST